MAAAGASALCQPSTCCLSESLRLRSRPPWAPWPPWSRWEEAGSARSGTGEETGRGSRGSSSAPREPGPGPPCPGPARRGSPPAPGCYGRRWTADSGTPEGQRAGGSETEPQLHIEYWTGPLWRISEHERQSLQDELDEVLVN